MGVTFRGNPFEQDGEYEDDDDWELTADEEWVTPPNEIVHVAILTTALSSDDDSDWLEEEYDDDHEEDEDFIPDEESLPEEDEDDLMESVAAIADREYYGSDLDDEIDYVTYPVTENNLSPEEDKATINMNNTSSRENNDTD